MDRTAAWEFFSKMLATRPRPMENWRVVEAVAAELLNWGELLTGDEARAIMYVAAEEV